MFIGTFEYAINLFWISNSLIFNGFIDESVKLKQINFKSYEFTCFHYRWFHFYDF